ncbi:hypothetical protein OPT61_g2413 [Boeremia exigua]|uniref:Uncharacterized protein n=1 Tax=Boeremia exigua TaxID=749465 RepID=A0ACC2ILL6_9PLEO|nr:hypothetical protein OPT61_g2413 [Boeremia exigua]
MDVQEVGDGFSDALLRQKQILERAQKRKGQRPRDWRPKDEMYTSFMMAIMMSNMSPKDTHRIHTSFIPPSYLPCSTSLAELRPINIRDLQLETHHRGRYLLVRAMTPPNRMTAIMVLVEDQAEHATMLQIYQQENETDRTARDIIDEGTVLILKEPYLKVMASGEYGLRVDHLSDIIEIDEHDPRCPLQWCPQVLDTERSVESLKQKGNEAVTAGKYWKAITQYTAAMLQNPTSDQADIVKRNRALAFLKTKQFDAALINTNFPDFGTPPSEKALFRAADALYQLQRFSEGVQILETLINNFPDNTKAKEVLRDTRNRCAEQTNGDYDFKRLQAAAKGRRPPTLGHATYTGPIEVRPVANKGRGMFVTKPVRAGDLLLCEQAFSHAWIDDREQSDSTFLLSIETGRGFAGGQADLITKTVQKLYRNPSLGRKFRDLYHGDYKPVESDMVDGRPIVDTFLVGRIMAYNVFGCPTTSIDSYKRVTTDTSKTQASFRSCGIWLQASYINHSCLSNVRRSFIGDMMIVRASRDLEAGTELTFWYHNPNGLSYRELQNKLKPWGFVCSCEMCDDARTTKAAVHTERERLLKQLRQLCKTIQSHKPSIKKYEGLLEALDATYLRPASEVPRLLLWDPQLLLVRIYNATNDRLKALDGLNKVLTALGFVLVGLDTSPAPLQVTKWGLMIDHLVEIFMHAQDAFYALGQFQDSKRAKEYAIVAYSTVVGESSSFESVHKT